MNFFREARAALRQVPKSKIYGEVRSVGGMELRFRGLGSSVKLGDHVLVGGEVRGEVVEISSGEAKVLPFGSWEGISPGDVVERLRTGTELFPCTEWMGRVLDAFGRPMDARALPGGEESYPVKAPAPDAFSRRSVGEKLETQVKAMDVFVPLCRGQRMGIFAGSGVGKSTLMGMLARQADVDVIVMGLVGERGREVRDFIARDLGPDGMKRSVLVVATSDQPALQRRQAAWTATAIAEYYRDQGKHVLLMIDSVTRFAMAQREIGLAAGEPPTNKGYTPTVFAELPKLLERSGPGNPGRGAGDITAIYTVLVDGDDMNEPIADSVRGILDGHVVLDRKIAERGRYPAINLQKSISRMLPHCHKPAELAIMTKARQSMAKYTDLEDLIKIGAYRKGSDPQSDRMIAFSENAEEFVGQGVQDPLSSIEAFATLYGLMDECGIELDLSQFSNAEKGNSH